MTDTEAPTPKRKYTTKNVAKGCLVLLVFYGMFFWVFSPIFCEPTSGSASASQTADKPSLFLSIISYVISALLTAVLLYSLVRGDARKHLVYFKHIRPLIIIQSILVISAVVAFGFVLVTLMPFLDRSWLYSIHITDGDSININLLPFSVAYLSLFYALLLILNLPALAHGEEMSYREGTINWGHATLRSIRFGMAHCFAGVPIFAGIALSLSGMWLTYQYFKGGVERSTTYHLTHNLIIITLILYFLLTNGLKL